MIRNPLVSYELLFGTTPGAYVAAKAALQAFFQANAAQQYVDEAAARATHALWANDRIWSHVKAELGL